MFRRFFTSIVVALVVLLFVPGVAHADEGLSLPVGTVIRAEPGTVIELGRAVIDQDLAGPLCTWSASATNQESVHLGNDIIVQSGDAELVLAGIEDSPGKVTTAAGSAYLTDEVVFLLRMGPEGLFSGGLDVSIHYETCQPEPTTTLPASTTVLEPTTTTIESTTTLLELTTIVESTTPTTAPATTEIAVGPAGPSTLPATTTSTSMAPAPAGPTLPVTGSGLSGLLAATGATLLTAGLVLFRWSQLAK